jgi:hypothetical protein
MSERKQGNIELVLLVGIVALIALFLIVRPPTGMAGDVNQLPIGEEEASGGSSTDSGIMGGSFESNLGSFVTSLNEPWQGAAPTASQVKPEIGCYIYDVYAPQGGYRAWYIYSDLKNLEEKMPFIVHLNGQDNEAGYYEVINDDNGVIVGRRQFEFDTWFAHTLFPENRNLWWGRNVINVYNKDQLFSSRCFIYVNSHTKPPEHGCYFDDKGSRHASVEMEQQAIISFTGYENYQVGVNTAHPGYFEKWWRWFDQTYDIPLTRTEIMAPEFEGGSNHILTYSNYDGWPENDPSKEDHPRGWCTLDVLVPEPSTPPDEYCYIRYWRDSVSLNWVEWKTWRGPTKFNSCFETLPDFDDLSIKGKNVICVETDCKENNCGDGICASSETCDADNCCEGLNTNNNRWHCGDCNKCPGRPPSVTKENVNCAGMSPASCNAGYCMHGSCHECLEDWHCKELVTYESSSSAPRDAFLSCLKSPVTNRNICAECTTNHMEECQATGATCSGKLAQLDSEYRFCEQSLACLDGDGDGYATT